MNRTLAAALGLALSLCFAAPSMAADEPLNVNTATVEELTALLGAEAAAGIASYREEIGDFMSLDELSEVPGMTKDLMEKAKGALSVDAIAGAECNC